MTMLVVTTDPLVTEVKAEALRVGKQLLTEDGWQTIRGLLVFAGVDQVTVFTDERDDVHTDGWPLRFGDRVQTRLEPTAEQEYQRRRRDRQEKKRLERLAMEAAGCPAWCTQHAENGAGANLPHSSDIAAVVVADRSDADKTAELNLRTERRDGRAVVGVLEIGGAFETGWTLTPAAMLQLSARLSSLAHRALAHR